MVLKAEKNLSIFSFKGLPKAALLAVAAVLLLEVSSGFLMRTVRQKCGGGDLARMDTDFFCRNFRPLCDRDAPPNPRWESRSYRSWKEMGDEGPFNIVVSGTSVAATGWAEMLKEEGLKILNTTGNPEFRGFLPGGIWNLLDHRAKLNARPGALLLYCALTERGDMDFRVPPEYFRKSAGAAERRKEKAPAFESRFAALWTYGLKKLELRRHPEIRLLPLEKGPELLQTAALAGLRREELQYSPEDQRILEEQFRIYREEAAQKGLRFVFIAFPTKPQMYEWLLGPSYRGSGRRPNLEAIRKACKKNEIPFLDIEKELFGAAREQYLKNGSLLWQHCDTHMNEQGSRLTAERVAKFLTSIYSKQ